MKTNCYCLAYPFPHRPNGGRCDRQAAERVNAQGDDLREEAEDEELRSTMTAAAYRSHIERQYGPGDTGRL